MQSRLRLIWPVLITAVWGCGGGDDGPSLDTESEAESGFTDSTPETGSESATETATEPSTSGPTGPSTEDTTASTGDPTGYETLGEGDMRGVLTFTLYPADAAGNPDIVGMAGAWRDVDDGVDELHDFFGLYGLRTNFPLPPQDADALEQNGLLADYDWGTPVQWLLAGNSMKLRRPDLAAHACLVYLGGDAEIEFPFGSGSFVPNYPMYSATDSDTQPEECRPDPSTWLPDTEYDIVLYGGELFMDNSLVGQVHTPPAFDVTSPDLETYNVEVDTADALDVEWNGDPNEGNRVVIRLWDSFGRMMTAHAEDDGSYSIPAEDLQELDLGPATIAVTRENIEEVLFTDGTVKTVTRYARWGYLDLI